MGCPCYTQNNIVKSKEIDLNEHLKTFNEINTCANITTTENNIQNQNVSKKPNNFLEKAKQNILKHSKDQKLKSKVKKHISVRNIKNIKKNLNPLFKNIKMNWLIKVKPNHKEDKENFKKLEKVKKKYCSGPIISLLESRYKSLSKKNLNIKEN